jgi:hypothetical protein
VQEADEKALADADARDTFVTRTLAMAIPAASL